ncbi:ABC transporter family substrate-binding protein [Nakamurella sp.]|uniref:ABC transporter family substrate-binding protein n=1 Tax=Nakamurella sp. TaxID=1869182 RepID=UPI003784D816
MRRTRAVAITALAAATVLVIAACGTAEPTSKASDTTSAAASSSSSAAGEDGVFTRPAVASSPNVTVAVEEPPHDYNNNTGAANNFSNSLVTALTLPSPIFTTNKLDLLVDGDLMSSIEQTSTSPQTVVYKINPKAVWSDGTPVSCNDFYLQWLAANSKATTTGEDGQPAPSFDPASTTGYDQMEAPTCSDNGQTVTTVYTTPFADWKGSFSGNAPLYPAHLLEKAAGISDITTIKPDDSSDQVTKAAEFYTKGWAGFNMANVLSAGPYMIQSVSDEQTVLVRNPKWWGNPGGPESITLVTNSNGQSQVQALQNQEVQVIQPQPDAALAQQLRSTANVTFNAYAGQTYEHIDFNMGLPLFQGDDGKALREAVFECVDRTDIIDKLVKDVNPDTVPLGNFQYLPSEANYVDHYADYTTANIDKAKQTMEAAGWTLGSDGVYTNGSKRAEFRLGHKVIDNRAKISQLVAGSCAKAGIKITDDQDAQFNATRLPASDFDAALFAWVGTPFKSSATGNYSTGGGSNYNKYSNPEVDTLFQQANVELDPAKRVELLNKMDQVMAGDFASLPLYQFSDMVAQTSQISPDLTYLGQGGGAMWNAFEWVYQQ